MWRGSTPPPLGVARDWVALPREHYVSVPKARLLERLAAGRSELGDLFRLSEAILRARWQPVLEQLKADYELFSPESGASARAGVPREELLARQRRFFHNFLLTMRRANFLPFTAEEARLAADQRYLFDLPASVNWKVLDARPLRDLREHLAGPSAEAARAREALELGPGGLGDWLQPSRDMSDHALVFFRGMGRDQHEGRYLLARVDVAVERLLKVLAFPLLVPLQWAVERARGEEPPPELTPAEPPGEVRRWVRRVNVRNLPLLATIGRKTRLQEPAFRQLVTVFRLEPQEEALLSRQGLFRLRATGELDTARVRRLLEEDESADAEGSGAEEEWSLWIKLFRQIPLADSEIVFPDMLLRMRSFDLALLLVSAAAVVPTLVTAFARPRGTAYAVMAALLVMIWRLVSRTIQVRQAYQARLTRDLYAKNLDTNAGVLQFLVDSLEEQELKEALLVYATLHDAGRPLSASELDQAIEARLVAEHAAEIDLEIEDALAKVKPGGPLPIVEELPGEAGSAPRYRALPIAAAQAALEERWQAWPAELRGSPHPYAAP